MTNIPLSDRVIEAGRAALEYTDGCGNDFIVKCIFLDMAKALVKHDRKANKAMFRSPTGEVHYGSHLPKSFYVAEIPASRMGGDKVTVKAEEFHDPT